MGTASAITPNNEPSGIEHSACIELDDQTEHVVVPADWKFLESSPANTRTSPSAIDAPFSSFTVSDSSRPPGSVQTPRWIAFPAASRFRISNRKLKRTSWSAGGPSNAIGHRQPRLGKRSWTWTCS
jgi:hypothetical protein